MSYNDDAVLAKLSALNESHDSIATAAQWIMFHRRHADRTVQLWLQRLKDSSSAKRLSLVYLANEVTQQSKARNKDDFVTAFSPIIAEATATAFRGAPADIQNKLRRVVDVWRDRLIFETPIQAAIESRIDELEKSRGAAKANFSNSVSSTTSISFPPELAPLATHQHSVSKLTLPTKTAISSAGHEYDKLMDPAAAVPSAPVYAARLNGLLKTLANADGAVTECVRARRELVTALEKVLATNRAVLANDEAQLAQLATRRREVENKKADVELSIMRGLGPVDAAGVRESPAEGGNSASPPPVEPDRPEIEALTPPDTTSQTPPQSPPREGAVSLPPSGFRSPTGAPGIEMLSNLASQYQSLPVSSSGANGPNKRRRIDSGDDFPDLGGDDDGIDADVAEMLRKDSTHAA